MSSYGQEQDPRVAALLAALRQQGHGKPLFGGSRVTGGGGGPRGLANYFRPMGAGINYNPLAAQMSQGAPGLLGLNSGRDTNGPPPASPTSPGDPTGGASGSAPPMFVPNPVDPTAPPVAAGSDGQPYHDTTQQFDPSWNPYGTPPPGGRRPGLQGLY